MSDAVKFSSRELFVPNVEPSVGAKIERVGFILSIKKVVTDEFVLLAESLAYIVQVFEP